MQQDGLVRAHDVIVMGGGIAGVSIGYEMAEDRSVCLLEMESTLAFHTTGRSAAAFLESYGNGPIRALTSASRNFLTDPPDIFETAVTSPLPLMFIASQGCADAVRKLHGDLAELAAEVELLDGSVAEQRNRLLRPGYTELALFEPGALEIDVHQLHQGFVRGLKKRGGTIIRSHPVISAQHDGTRWRVRDGSGSEHRAAVIVNAAGAWSDRVGAVFGAPPVGVRPLRRTIFMAPSPAGLQVDDAPLTIDINDEFYFKPGLDQVLCSPADETPRPPEDARADHLEIARAIDAINEATLLDVRHVRSSWAGLRSFVADRTPVVGFDPQVEGLFWYAGQGGYGIQISPAMARVGAALIRGDSLPADVAGRGLLASQLDPDRPAIRRDRLTAQPWWW